MSLVWITIAVVTGISIFPVSFAEDSISNPLNTPFELQLDQTAFFEPKNIQVTIFNIKDSRCPISEECEWGGIVQVGINMNSTESDNNRFYLGTSDRQKLVKQFDEYFLQLKKVEPYPTSTTPITKSDYVVTLKLNSIEGFPPLKQIKNGILPSYVICEDGYGLIFKSSNEYSACVKPSSVEKFVQRGWNEIFLENKLNSTIKINDSENYIKYHISENSKIVESEIIEFHVLLQINTVGKGNLVIELPRNVIDSKHDYCPYRSDSSDDGFVILENQIEILATEIQTTSEFRTLSIPFSEDVKELEILATCLI